MGLVELKCKSCGANLTVNDDAEIFTCDYCGATLTHETIHHKVSGTVKVAGIADTDNLVERASILLRTGEFARAREFYERALESSPRHAKAYWGIMLCDSRVKNAEAFIAMAEDITDNQYYKMAVEFADYSDKSYYLEIGAKSKEAFNNHLIELKNEADKKLKSGYFSDAQDKYNRILSLSPGHSDIYWGLLLCQCNATDDNELVKKAVDVTEIHNYKMALSYAQGDKKQYYMNVGERAKAADKKKTLRLNLTKYALRILLYASFLLSVAMFGMLFYVDGLFSQANPDDAVMIDKLTTMENTVIAVFFASSIFSLISNKVLIYIKDILGNLVIDKFKYVLWVLFGISAFAFFVTFIF